MSPDLPVLRVKVWLARLIREYMYLTLLPGFTNTLVHAAATIQITATYIGGLVHGDLVACIIDSYEG